MQTTPAIKAKPGKLAKLQKSLGLNDSGMADKIGCTRQTWRHAVEGKNVSAGFIARFTVAFGAPFDAHFEIAHPTAEAA